jgi:hypothetical protein
LYVYVEDVVKIRIKLNSTDEHSLVYTIWLYENRRSRNIKKDNVLNLITEKILRVRIIVILESTKQ